MSKKRDEQLANLAYTIADHQARIEKLGVKWAAQLVEKLDATEKRLLDEITSFAEKHGRGLNSVTALSDLSRLERKIAKIRNAAFAEAQQQVLDEAFELYENEQNWAKKLTKTLEPESAGALSVLPAKAVKENLANMMISNMTAAEWFSGTAAADVSRIVDAVREGVRSGWTIPELTRKIMGTKANNYADGIIETSRKHATTMARTLCGGIANNAKDEFYRENDDVVIGVEWLDTLDSRTCSRCGGLSRKRWKTKEPHPVPPIHHNCYDSETRVMTNKGLKYFRDLDGSELFFSFNPQTEQLEFVPAVRHIRYTVNENLIRFKNNRFDLLVTANHRMFGYRKAKGCIEGYKFYEAENMPKWGYRIPSGANWTGRKSELSPRRIAWLRFMAFWLADGSVTKRSDNYYQIKIAQCNNNWMREELKDFPRSLGNQKSCLMFSDSRIGKYLMRFGHAADKFIPADIKNSSPEEIGVFLDAFAKTDGRICPGKNWKGYQFNPSVCYFTSSERMRDDLCELILKSGGRPSVTTQKTKGKVQKFRNGEYTINSDGYIIHHLRQTGTHANTLTRESVPYSGEVFCVELERNHTLYVERNGKFCWCGNCRCVLIPVTELTDLGEDVSRPAANADFDAEAKELYEKKYPGKKFEDLAASTRKKYFYEAQKEYTKRTGNPPYRQVPGNMTFAEYFQAMPDSEKLRYLGPGKYEVWKNGKLPIEKFFPPYPERTYTVKELKEMDKKSFRAKPIKEEKKKEEKENKKQFIPAKTIQEAEDYISRFVDSSKFGATGVSYKGVNIDVANAINNQLGVLFETFDVQKIGGIIAPAKNSKLGQNISGAFAAYSPVRNSFLLNRDSMKNIKTAREAFEKERDAIKSLLTNPERYDFSKLSPRTRRIVERAKTSGRTTVPQSIEEAITHEFGHCIEKSVKKHPLWSKAETEMKLYADKISGYAGEDVSEYIAESFVSYIKGEAVVDPNMTKIFDSLRQK